jgi:hypothetical protein
MKIFTPLAAALVTVPCVTAQNNFVPLVMDVCQAQDSTCGNCESREFRIFYFGNEFRNTIQFDPVGSIRATAIDRRCSIRLGAAGFSFESFTVFPTENRCLTGRVSNGNFDFPVNFDKVRFDCTNLP